MKYWLWLILWGAGLAQAQSAYRWVDEQGKVHFSDRPPPAAAGKVEKRPINAPTAADTQQPYAVRQATTKFPVILYVTTECGELCKQSADYLRKQGVPFSEKVLATPQDVAALAQRLGGEAQVPVLQVGSKTSKGFLESSWRSLLDAAGYPKKGP
jgi:hypothetical protein